MFVIDQEGTSKCLSDMCITCLKDAKNHYLCIDLLRHIRRLKTAEMNFMRCTAEYILLDHRRYKDILQELKVV